MEEKYRIPLFYPYVNDDMRNEVMDTLHSRWIGQGVKVDQFEQAFAKKFNQQYVLSFNSGSSALETAYELAGIKPGDEVLTTPYTCSATNIPLLRMGAKLVFADIKKDTLNIDFADVQRKITEKTKAIVNVHMGGIESVIPREMEVGLKERGIKVISDACQALGVFNGDYVCNSFQAIKSITTGDGGMLTVYDPEEYRVAKLKRWFGIDRVKKRAEGWQAYKEREMTFDIFLLGYKRQMTDIAAGMGLAGLRVYDEVLRHRKAIFERYKNNLKEINGITLIDGDVNKYWLVTVLVEKRDEFAKMCKFYDIETNMVHIRNDAYKIFGGRRYDLPNMDWVEPRYICLPINMKVSIEDVDYICDCIKKGW